jgi:hypothetical protein
MSALRTFSLRLTKTVVCPGDHPLLEQRALAFFGCLHGGELRLGAVKRRLGASNRDLLDRGVDGGERRALGDRIADVDVAFKARLKSVQC